MKLGIAGRIAQAFIKSKLSVLLIFAALGLGAFSIYLTPSEEEPQISVPLADVFIQYQGANPQEVESRVIEPMEKIQTQVDEFLMELTRRTLN